MEKVLSEEEKLRRAEEIYMRRRMGGARLSSNNINTGTRPSKKNYIAFKKMGLQIAICVVLYLIMYLVQNSNYLFSESVITKTREILAYDINFQEKAAQVMQLINKPKEEKQEQTNENNVNIEEKAVENNQINAVGGAEHPEETLAATDKREEDSSSTSQMQQDVDYIKEHCSINYPLKGTITSHYGLREIKPKFHTGIDIAANMGTVIVSAMDGDVKLVSAVGDYGNHVKITNGEISTLYAHCKTIYVKEGEKIKQGQKIAEVGLTGNTTGPHLHFEIIRGDRTIDPEYILKF